MGERGRQKGPVELRVLHGRREGYDSGGRPIEMPPPFDKAGAGGSAPVPPDYLSPYAREVWDRSIPQLVRMKLTKAEDFATLAAYCEAVSQFRECTIDIARNGTVLTRTVKGHRWIPFGSDDWSKEACEIAGEGYFVPEPNTETKINPAVGARDRAMTQLRALGNLFGLSPGAEANLAGLIDSRAARGTDQGAEEANPFAGTA